MSDEFARKAAIVAEVWMICRDNDAWSEIIKYGDLGFPLGYAHKAKLATLQPSGKKTVVEIYDVIVESLGIEDKEYEDFEAMLDQKIADQESDDEKE